MTPRSFALIAACLLASALAALGHPRVGFALFIFGLAGYFAWGWARLRLAYRRIARARVAFDGASIRREVDALARYVNELSPFFQELRVERALGYMMEQRFEDAERELAAVPLDRLPARSRAAALGNRAFCHPELGRAAEAVAEATQSSELAQDLGPAIEAVHQGILGAAYVKAGEPARAVPLLEAALAKGDPTPGLQVMRELYLGDALRQLGDEEKARAAWKRALAHAPRHPFARRAAERLGR